MKHWIQLFCNSFVDTVYFGMAVIATAISLGAMFQIICNSLIKYLKIF